MRYADSRCDYTEEYKDGNHFYIYTGPCVISGKKITVRIPGKELYAYRKGELIQHAMPSLTPAEREFLISGISGEEWDNVTKEEE